MHPLPLIVWVLRTPLRRALTALAGLIAVLAVGLLDYITGAGISFAGFYVLVIVVFLVAALLRARDAARESEARSRAFLASAARSPVAATPVKQQARKRVAGELPVHLRPTAGPDLHLRQPGWWPVSGFDGILAVTAIKGWTPSFVA